MATSKKPSRETKAKLLPTDTVVSDVTLVPNLQDAPEPQRSLRVEVVGGPMDGLRSRAPGPTLTLGRGTHNDMRLPLDPMISSTHARIVREGDHYWLEDRDSRNGTWLGDKRLHGKALITPGATFIAGHTRLEFMPD